MGLLADEVSRSLLIALGDAHARGLGGLAVTEEPLPGTTPRVVRERLRELERAGVVEVTERAAAGGGLTPARRSPAAGRDLHRLLSLITRIVARASTPRAVARRSAEDRAVGDVLGWFADPASVQVLRALATTAAPVGPVALEEAAFPTPRRTVYRKLRPLLDAGAVTRIPGRTVPRSTQYELADRWRPVAAIPVLGAWWEIRYWPGEAAAGTIDLTGVMHSIAPQVRVNAHYEGRQVDFGFDSGLPAAQTLRAGLSDERIRLSEPPPGASAADAAAHGTNGAWATALVTDRTDGLTLEGDQTLARDAINGVRAALLAYVR